MNVWRMHLWLVTATVFEPYLLSWWESHLILDDLVVSSVLQRTPRKSYSLALSCSFYYPSLFLQPSSDVASPQPVPSSPWSNINGFVKNPFGCSAPMSAPESTLYTLQFYNSTATVTASVEMFFYSLKPKGSLLMLILFMQVVEQWRNKPRNSLIILLTL